YVHWIQSHVLPAIRIGLSGNAAALPRLRAGISNLQRHVQRRRVHPRRRLSAPADLFNLVAEAREKSAGESLERDRPGMANHLSTTEAQFQRHTNRHRTAVSIFIGRSRKDDERIRTRKTIRPMTNPPTALQEQFAEMPQQKQAATLGMWAFLATEVLFFGAMFLSYIT